MVIATSTTVVAPSTAERCDRCGARAFVRTTFAADQQVLELLWCGHHFAAHEASIRERAVLVQDQRDSIDATLAPVE